MANFRQIMISLLTVVLMINPVLASSKSKKLKSHDQKKSLKASIELKLEYNQEIPLRVTSIPTEFGMINKDLDAKVLPLGLGSQVIFENTENITRCEELKLEEDISKSCTTIIPAGSKFIGKISSLELAKHFNKDGYVQLEFEKILVNGSSIDLKRGSLTADNIELRESFKNKASKFAKTAAYTVGGALAAPYIAYKIAGLFTFSSPYIPAGAAALGAATGLALGIYSKGKNFNLEPGSEIKIKLNNNWIISQFEDDYLAEALELLSGSEEEPNNNLEAKIKNDFKDKLLAEGYQELIVQNIKDPLELKINEVKKSGSEFGKNCLKVNLNYKNHSNESLSYLSFRLVDSMNKDYLPEIKSIGRTGLGKLPQQANLDLFYCVDFIKAIHNLEVRSKESYELLAAEKVFL